MDDKVTNLKEGIELAEYYVEMPVTMKLMVGVKANSKEEALEKVFNGQFTLDMTCEDEDIDNVDYEWEMHERVVRGNVYFGLINEVYVEEEE